MKKTFSLLFAIIFLSLINSCGPKATCSDNNQNQGELGVDCGGPCTDCPTCIDGIQNQNETAVDCGGPCISCVGCSDGIQNQNETGIDCGGSCQPCKIIYPRMGTTRGVTEQNILNDSTILAPPHAYVFSAILPENTSIRIRIVSTDVNGSVNLDLPPNGWTGVQITKGAEYTATGPISGTVLIKFNGSGILECFENGATTPTKTRIIN